MVQGMYSDIRRLLKKGWTADIRRLRRGCCKFARFGKLNALTARIARWLGIVG
jgi:hypothetical protein